MRSTALLTAAVLALAFAATTDASDIVVAKDLPVTLPKDHCFVDRFRGLSGNVTEARQRAAALDRQALSASSTVYNGVLIGVGAVMLVAGGVFVKPILFTASFALGAMATFLSAEAVAAHVALGASTQCYFLSIAPLVGGLICALITIALVDFAFWLLGASCGAMMGYFVYIAFLSGVHVSAHPQLVLGYDYVFWIAVLVPTVLGGCAMVRKQDRVTLVATALIGAYIFVLGFVGLVLVRFNVKFREAFDARYYGKQVDSLHYVWPVFAAWILISFVGIQLQIRGLCCKSSKKEKGEGQLQYGQGSYRRA